MVWRIKQCKQMRILYLIETSIQNGTIKNVIDRSCFENKQISDLVKEKVDNANKNSSLKTETNIYQVTLFQSENEIPILNPDAEDEVKQFEKYHHYDSEKAKKLQERLVQCCIDYIRETGDTEIEEVDFRADSLQESAKKGTWQPCTDSLIEMNTFDILPRINSWDS